MVKGPLPRCADCLDTLREVYGGNARLVIEEIKKKDFCTICPTIANQHPLLSRLLDVMGMQDGGAAVPFAWLRPWEWQLLGQLKAERERLSAEAQKEK